MTYIILVVEFFTIEYEFNKKQNLRRYQILWVKEYQYQHYGPARRGKHEIGKYKIGKYEYLVIFERVSCIAL